MGDEVEEGDAGAGGDVPPWWDENVAIRDELGIPGYDAPRFEDGRYVHDVVEEVEARHGAQVRFVDPDPSRLSRWEVRLDGQPIGTVRRTRDVDANTVFRMTAAEFERLVAEASDDDA